MNTVSTGSCPIKRRRSVTVERLLDAALATFADLGYQAASVEDICKRGGFTRGAFYSSFKTKDELFAALFRRESARKLGQLTSQLAGLENEADPVATAVERCLGAFGEDEAWERVNLEYTLLAAREPDAAAVLAEHRDQVFAQLADLIGEASRRAGITLAIPASQLARITAALHDGIALQEMPAGLHGTAASLQQFALLLLLRGVTGSAPQPPAQERLTAPHNTEGHN